MTRLGGILTAAAVLALIAACGSPAEPASQVTTTTAAKPQRLSYAEFCPQVLPHLSAAADLVTQFVADANAGNLAYSVAAENRFDTVIDDFDRDRRVAPQPLVRLINAQRDTLVQMRGHLQVGGERVIEMEAFRSSGPAIILQCGANS